MAKKTSVLLLLLAVAVLSGCNQAIGPNATAIQQIGGSENKAAGEQQDIARQQEELKQANDRAKIAEERAELERQKREFAEQKLREAEESSNGVAYTTPQVESAPVRQSVSHHRTSYQAEPEEEYTWFQWDCDEPLPEIGEVLEDEDGYDYEVVGRNGYCIKTIRLDEA